LYPKSVVKPQLRSVLVPRPQTAAVGGHPLRGEALLEWARTVIDTTLDAKEHAS
jgi:transcription-repair coupling factor (superfamily II helicase)